MCIADLSVKVRYTIVGVALLTTLTASGGISSFNPERLDFSALQNRYGPHAAARFRYLNRLIESLKSSDVMTKLKEVNDFWNGVRYGSDMKVWGKRDYWATPYETLLKDRGDCEDYVIAKYFTLKELGIDASRLYFVYVRVKGKNIPHMVLAYYGVDGSDPLILDNINLKIFTSRERRDILPVYTFNGELLRRFTDKSADGLAQKGVVVQRKWDDLMERMKRFEP